MYLFSVYLEGELMSLRTLRNIFLQYTPSALRKHITRRFLDMNYSSDVYKDIAFKIAETREELDGAFSLIQKEYERKKLVGRNSTGLRLTKYNLLPTTTVFIAKDLKTNQVIGTISLILDSSFGLPIDNFASLGELRKYGDRIAEVSSLAVEEEWVKKGSTIFLALAGICTNYSANVLGCRYNVYAIDKRAMPFYEDVLLCSKLATHKDDYSYVNSPGAAALFSDLKDYEQRYYNAYRYVSSDHNIYEALFNPVWKDLIEIEYSRYNISSKQRLNAKNILNVLNTNLDLQEKLSLKEVMVLSNIYPALGKKLSKIKNGVVIEAKRDSHRIHVNMEALFTKDTNFERSRCFELSQNGGCLKIPSWIEKGDIINLKLFVNVSQSIKVKARIVWTKENRAGFMLITNHSSWNEVFVKLSSEYVYDENIFYKDYELAS